MRDAFAPTQPQPRLVAFICRCSSPHEHGQRAAQFASDSAQSSIQHAKDEADKAVKAANARAAELLANRPDPDRYEVEDVAEVGPHLVLKVKYPSCAKCAYEGNKVLVILNVKTIDVLKWKRIDPHFRLDASDHKTAHPKLAPSPAARFPASSEGWQDALAYARGKTR